MTECSMSPFGDILHAFLEPPSDGGPPYTFAWAPAEPEEPAAPSRPLTRRERDRLARTIGRAFDVPLWIVGIGLRPSRVANAKYHQRQRNRVKRRRR